MKYFINLWYSNGELTRIDLCIIMLFNFIALIYVWAFNPSFSNAFPISLSSAWISIKDVSLCEVSVSTIDNVEVSNIWRYTLYLFSSYDSPREMGNNIWPRSFSFKKHPDKEIVVVAEETPKPTLSYIIKRNLKPEYTFENFITGEANRINYNAKIQESTHVFVSDYVALDFRIEAEKVRMVINHKIYDVTLIDNPMELNAQLEIYLKHVGG